MIRSMGIVGRSLIVVVMAVTALAGAFDGCLMHCHAQPPAVDTQAHAHCHPAPPSQPGALWQADPTCHHEHDVFAAERAVRTRLGLRPLSVIVASQELAVRPLALISSVATRSTADRSTPIVGLLPLRV